MKFLDKMERKIGHYAIKNISLCLIICYAFGYAISLVNSNFLSYLTLNPQLILQGQVWRILTWIIVPPSSFGFFTIIMLYFYYSIGNNLEKTWGAFRYNVYLISGMLFTVFGSFLVYWLSEIGLIGANDIAVIGSSGYYTLISYYFNTYYINMSIFLAFAATFPEVQILLMMIIPVKVKWIGIAYGGMLLYEFIIGTPVTKFVIGASLLNFVVFFLLSGNHFHMKPSEIKRRQTYKKQVMRPVGITKHKCAICGRTEQDGELEFRFCSKCEGNYEYCRDHLFTHEHVKKS